MSCKYDGTVTEENLRHAFAMESQARNKYTFYSSIAKKEGYEQIAAVFLKIADNEKEHAKLWFKALEELGCTPQNLMHAAAAENEEWTEMYDRMANEAEYEGFDELAETMRGIAKIEKNHESMLRQLLHNIEKDEVFVKTSICMWECRNCGHIHVDYEAPEKCPVCNHAKAFFELKANNY